MEKEPDWQPGLPPGADKLHWEPATFGRFIGAAALANDLDGVYFQPDPQLVGGREVCLLLTGWSPRQPVFVTAKSDSGEMPPDVHWEETSWFQRQPGGGFLEVQGLRACWIDTRTNTLRIEFSLPGVR